MRCRPDLGVLAHRRGVAQAPSLQLIAPVRFRPVGRIGQHGPGRHSGSDGSFDLFQRHRTLGAKVDLRWHSGALAPRPIGCPLLGQIQLIGHRQTPLCICYRQTHRHLAIVGLAVVLTHVTF